MCRSVVGVRLIDGRNRRIDRLNLLVTIRHHEIHLSEVRVEVHEGFGRQTHAGLAVGIIVLHHILAGRGSFHAFGKAEVVDRIKVATDIVNRVARHCVRLTVVVNSAGITMQRNRNLLQRVHLHKAVLHREGHYLEVGVRARVLEETRHEVHVRGTGVRTGGRAVGSGTGELDILGIVTRRRDIRDAVARHRVRVAVVSHLIRVTFDLHRSSYLVDGQPTIHHMELNIEVSVEILELLLGKTHIGSTRIRASGRAIESRTIQLEVRRIIVDVRIRLVVFIHTTNRISVAAHALLFAVIVLRGGITRDVHNHDTSRHNLQPTVFHREGNIEVGVSARELIGSQTHWISVRHRTSSYRIAAEHDIRGFKESAAGNCIKAFHRLLKRGIFMHERMSLDGHIHRNRLNGLETVRHLEGHVVEVSVRVGELALGKTHIGGTGIRAGGRGHAAEREVVLGVERRRDVRDHIVLNRVRRTVIIMGSVVTGNRHGSVHLVDGEAAVGDMEHHIREVRVGVGKLILGKTHRIGAGIGLGQRGITREGEVVLGVSRSRIGVHNHHVIARHRVLLRVVVGRGGMAGDVHNHRSRRHNLNPTVRHLLDGHVVVAIDILELRCRQAHVGLTHRRASRNGRLIRFQTEVRILTRDLILRIRSCGREAFHRLIRAVLNQHGGITRDRHGNIHRIDGELGRFVGHRVVALGGVAFRGDDILADILAVRRTRLCTADGVGDGILGIAVLQTGHRRGEGRIRRAEVLGLGIGLHRNRHRLDGELRRIVGHRVVALRGGAGRGNDILADILASRTADGIGDDACCIIILQFAHRRGEGRIVFTIVLLLGFGLDGNVGAGDGQITGHVGHRVVALCGLAGRRNLVRADILADCRTRLCTADGHHKRTSAHKVLLRVTVLQAIGNRPSQIGIALAINLRLIIRRHRQRSLRHIDGHNLLLLAAVRGLGAVGREGHRVVARRCRSAGEGIG